MLLIYIHFMTSKLAFQILLFICIISILYLLVIMPKIKRNPESKKFDGWLYAHRGFHDNRSNAPENSLPAFLLAVEHHYGIELDVQLTKDKVPVILHDYNLMRSSGIDQRVADLTYEELQQYHLFQSQERIPSLKEALNCINGTVPLIIELKIPWTANELCTAVSKALEDYTGLYCIESFNPFGLMWYKKYYPKVVRGQLSTDFVRQKITGSKVQFFLLRHLLTNFLTKPDFIAYNHKYKKNLSFALCRKLYRVKTFAWTIKTQDEFETNIKHYENFIFDSFHPKQ